MSKSYNKKFNINTQVSNFMVRVRWDKKDRVYLVNVPSLKGAFTFGKTIAEAKKMAKDVIGLCCECLFDEGKIVIDDAGSVRGMLPASKLPKERIISLARLALY